jgi:hypothetical protein
VIYGSYGPLSIIYTVYGPSSTIYTGLGIANDFAIVFEQRS